MIDMNVLDECIGDKEAIEIRDWWLEINGIPRDPDKRGIMSDEEAGVIFFDYLRSRREEDYLIFLRESMFYSERYENFRSKKMFFDIDGCKFYLN